MSKNKNSETNFAFYKPSLLAIIALILAFVLSVIIFLPYNFVVEVGQYSLLFYVLLIAILIITFGSVFLYYFAARSEIAELVSENKKHSKKHSIDM